MVKKIIATVTYLFEEAGEWEKVMHSLLDTLNAGKNFQVLLHGTLIGAVYPGSEDKREEGHIAIKGSLMENSEGTIYEKLADTVMQQEREINALADLIYQMRQAQKDYFRTRNGASLQKSRTLEFQADKKIDEIRGRRDGEQKQLF